MAPPGAKAVRLETAVVQLAETVPLRASVAQETTEPELAEVVRKAKPCFYFGLCRRGSGG